MTNQFPSPEEFEEFLKKFKQSGGESGLLPEGMDTSSFGSILASITSAFTQSSADGERPIDWQVAKNTATELIASREIPESGSSLATELIDAERIARGWIAGATDFVATELDPELLSRKKWIDRGIENLRIVATPIAEKSSRDALANFQRLLPGQPEGMFGRIHDKLASVAANLHGVQLGNFLALLAEGVLLGTELKLSPSKGTAYVAEGITEFKETANAPGIDSLVYLAARELLAVGLMQHNPWISESLATQVTKFAGSISFNSEGMQDLQDALEAADFDSVSSAMGALVNVKPSPEQLEAQTAIRLLLTLFIGWIDARTLEVCRHIKNIGAVDEAYRRRRATNSPIARVMKLLLNTELTESSIRGAAAFWREVYTRIDLPATERLWSHPDLMPTAPELADPNLLFSRLASIQDDAFDVGLRRLLEGPDQA